MSTAARIYAMCNGETGKTEFVKATNQAQAYRHLARRTFTASVASAIAVAEHMTNGGMIEDATKEPESTTEDKE